MQVIIFKKLVDTFPFDRQGWASRNTSFRRTNRVHPSALYSLVRMTTLSLFVVGLFLSQLDDYGFLWIYSLASVGLLVAFIKQFGFVW